MTPRKRRGMDPFKVLAWRRMRDGLATGLVYRGSDTVMEWHGDVSILEELQREDMQEILGDGDYGDEEWLALAPGTWVAGETQYGDILRIPGYYEWEVIASWTIDELYPGWDEEADDEGM